MDTQDTYLCARSPYSGDFICSLFLDFKMASDYQKKHHYDRDTAILTVCKYTPPFLKPCVLNYKLWKRFITVRIEGRRRPSYSLPSVW